MTFLRWGHSKMRNYGTVQGRDGGIYAVEVRDATRKDPTENTLRIAGPLQKPGDPLTVYATAWLKIFLEKTPLRAVMRLEDVELVPGSYRPGASSQMKRNSS